MNFKFQKRYMLVAVLALVCAIAPVSNAMHIMEGYLAPVHCIVWGILCLPFLAVGFVSLSKLSKDNRKILVIVAMAGAYAFVLSALKIPSVTGSSSHMTGTGLCAILFGPFATSIIGLIVLLFQAILLAHGGITTLGANVFSMAIAGPILSYIIYKVLSKTGLNKKVIVFLAATLGDLFTYCVTSVQLSLAYPDTVGGFSASLVKFLGIFAATQIPLAIIEGILTVIVVMGLESFAVSELKSIGFMKEA